MGWRESDGAGLAGRGAVRKGVILGIRGILSLMFPPEQVFISNFNRFSAVNLDGGNGSEGLVSFRL